MQGHFKLKNKLSFSPNKTKDNVYKVRARIGKKHAGCQLNQLQQRLMELNRHSSLSAHKIKANASKLFRGAHGIQTKETYLINQKTQKLSKTNQSSSPLSPSSGDRKVITAVPYPPNLRSMSNSRVENSIRNRGLKDIQRTVSITIKGRNEGLPSEKDLMTTLSKIILCGQRSQDDFYLQIQGESSIHGDQQNYIDLGSHLLSEQDFKPRDNDRAE